MLAMQASQVPKTAEENKELPEPTKQSPKKISKAERRRTKEKAALAKKGMKRSTKPQAKPPKVPLNKVAGITTSTEPSTSIEASTRQNQEIPGAESKEVNDDNTKGNIPGEQTVNTPKVDDIKHIKDIKDTAKKPKKPKKPMKVAGKVKISSTDAKRNAAVVATVNELQNSEERPGVATQDASDITAHYCSQLLLHLKANPEDLAGSLFQLRVILHISSDAIED